MVDNKRFSYLNYLRGIACIFVVFIHVAAYGYISGDNMWSLIHDNAVGGGWQVNVVILAVTKTAVPLFVMISGALLLNKDYSKSQLFQKIKKLIILIMAWNILFAFGHFIIADYTVYEVLQLLAYGYGPFWYLYMLLILYLSLPILRQIAKEKRILQWFIILFICWITIDSIFAVFLCKNIAGKIGVHLMSESGIDMFPCWAGYLCLGYYIHRFSDLISKRIKYVIAGTAFLTLILSIHFSMISSFDRFNLKYIEVFTINTLLMTILIFIFIKEQEKFLNQSHIGKFLDLISKRSFGIFVFHCLYIEILKNMGISLNLFNKLGIGTLLMTAVVIIMSYLTIVILEKIPFIRKIVLW